MNVVSVVKALCSSVPTSLHASLLLYSNMWAQTESACDFLLLRSLTKCYYLVSVVFNELYVCFILLTDFGAIHFFDFAFFSSFLAKTPSQRYDFFWICIFFFFLFYRSQMCFYNQATSRYSLQHIRIIRCVLNAFVDDENQSDSLITIGNVPDNRVKHILCLFTYLSHRIPIYRAACNIHTHHIPWSWRVTRYAVHFTIP